MLTKASRLREPSVLLRRDCARVCYWASQKDRFGGTPKTTLGTEEAEGTGEGWRTGEPSVLPGTRGRAPSRVLPLNERAHAQHGLRVDLRNPPFRDAENRRDFREAHPFQIIHREHFLLHVGQLLELAEDELHQFLFLQIRVASRLRVICDDFVQRHAFRVVVKGLAIERQKAHRFDFVEQLLVLIAIEAQCFADFLVERGPAQALLQRGDAFAVFLRLVADRARRPIHAPKLIVDRAADVQRRERGKRDALRGIEFFGRRGEAREGNAVEIIHLKRRRQIDAHAIDRGFQKREVPLDEGVLIDLGMVCAQCLDGTLGWRCGDEHGVQDLSDDFSAGAACACFMASAR